MEEEEAAGEGGKAAGDKERITPAAKRWGSALDSFLLLFIIVVTLGFQVSLFVRPGLPPSLSLLVPFESAVSFLSRK